MISLDLSAAVAAYLFSVILLVIGIWIFYNYSTEKKGQGDAQYLQQCPFCTHVFFDYENSKVKICPRCESYIAAEDTGAAREISTQNKKK
ncbi:MAG: hypothetical protein WC676_06295 [Candidatus Omnitrophota bacterium]